MLNLCKFFSKKNLFLEMTQRKRFRVENFTFLTRFQFKVSIKSKHFLSLLRIKKICTSR